MARTFPENRIVKKLVAKRAANANRPVSSSLDRTQLNVAADGHFYEKAASRRSRHRLALLRSKSADEAVPLALLGRCRAVAQPRKPRPTSATNFLVAPEFEEDPNLLAIKGKPLSFKGQHQIMDKVQKRIIHRSNDATTKRRDNASLFVQSKSAGNVKQRRRNQEPKVRTYH